MGCGFLVFLLLLGLEVKGLLGQEVDWSLWLLVLLLEEGLLGQKEVWETVGCRDPSGPKRRVVVGLGFWEGGLGLVPETGVVGFGLRVEVGVLDYGMRVGEVALGRGVGLIVLILGLKGLQSGGLYPAFSEFVVCMV